MGERTRQREGAEEVRPLLSVVVGRTSTQKLTVFHLQVPVEKRRSLQVRLKLPVTASADATNQGAAHEPTEAWPVRQNPFPFLFFQGWPQFLLPSFKAPPLLSFQRRRRRTGSRAREETSAQGEAPLALPLPSAQEEEVPFRL